MSTSTQIEYVNAAHFWENACFERGHIACIPAESLHWTFEYGYPVSRLHGFTENTVQGLVLHQACRNEGCGGESFPVRWWEEPQDFTDSVVLVEVNGSGYVWDGNHRTAFAVDAGCATIPALVGRPKQ